MNIMQTTNQTVSKPILTVIAAISLFILVSYASAATDYDEVKSEVTKGSNKIKSKLVKPAPEAGFIKDSDLLEKRSDMPFQKVWIKPGYEKSFYKELIVAPVNTQYMLEMDWLHKASAANWVSDVEEDIQELAKYFHDQVVKEFKGDVNHRFKVIEHIKQSQQRALRLELALIQIDPSVPVLHALGYASPVPGMSTAASVINRRSAAFEGRLRDLKTGEIVALFADRDTQDIGPIDVSRLTWYGPSKGIMRRWAKQFVQVANAKPGEAVTDPVAFTLMPFDPPTLGEELQKIKEKVSDSL